MKQRYFASRGATGARQRGVAMVEFVIATPLLFFVMYCICEFGNAFMQYSVLTDAARDADRYLASNALLGSTGVVNVSPTMAATARNLVVYGNSGGRGRPLLTGLAPWQVGIAVDPFNNVSVNVTYPYQSLFGGRIPLFMRRGSIDTGDILIRVYTSMVAL
jgi:Flp pilus assembly protein TadG